MSENGCADRSSFLSRDTRRFAEIAIPGMPPVRIQSLTEYEASHYESQTMNESGRLERERMVDSKVRLIILCVVDKDGHRLFSDADVESIRSIDAGITSRLWDECRSHCGLDNDSELEELAKNLLKTDGDDSLSVSPDLSVA